MPDLVPPEIEKLYDLAFDVKEEGWESCSATSCVSVEQAEAAVLACEQRMKHDLLDRDLEATALRAERDSERQRTVAEIVKELRLRTAEFAFAEGDYAEGQEVGWIDAADYVEQRFG